MFSALRHLNEGLNRLYLYWNPLFELCGELLMHIKCEMCLIECLLTLTLPTLVPWKSLWINPSAK